MAQGRLKKIGKYEVVDVLGRGGMGVVYKATDPSIGRQVAIKMITAGYAEDPDLLKRFYREAQSTGILQHANIVTVYDLGDQDGNPYLVMEFLEGESLETIINSRRAMPVLDKLNLVIQVCNGLEYAHRRNVVHRDIKPANVMVLKDGAVKIVDFGIARLGNDSVTRPGQVVGSFHYMSPEQINAAPVDARTDIFSSGVVLYQLLTHALPFEGKDTGSTLLKIIHEPPPPLHQYLKMYPPELDSIVQRALAKDREERYQSAEDLAFDLMRVQEHLKRAMIAESIDAAEALLEKQELTKAKEILTQILRLDRQHARANDLLRETQQRMQKQQRAEQARQLRMQAEEALDQRQTGPALEYLEQAVALDKANEELVRLRDSVREAKRRAEALHEALRRAESAQFSGEPQEALAAVNEALQLDPNDSEARALHASITRDVAERQRQREVQNYLDEARKQISSRRFTAALEVLKQAEHLDPVAANVHELINVATTGREQELRRKELEQLSAQIEEALNRDDYVTACAKADEALQKFPSDRGLLKLKTLADRQRESGERRRYVEQQLAAARRQLESGNTTDALIMLEKASQKYPGDAGLQSLMAIVKAQQAREAAEQRKGEYIQKAKDALRRKAYAEAIQVLETGRAEIESPELDDLLQFAHEEAAHQFRQLRIDTAAEQAQRLMADEEYERAIEFLEETLREVSDDELRIVLAEARRHIEEFNRKVREAITTAERLLRNQKVNEAVRFLESQPSQLARSTDFCAALEKAREEQDRIRAIATATENVRLALSRVDFGNANAILETCRRNYGDQPELKILQAEINAKRTQIAKEALEKAIGDARMLLLVRSYGAALNMLQAVASFAADAPEDIRTRYQALKKDAMSGAARQQRQSELRDTIARRKPTPKPLPKVGDTDETLEQTAWSGASTSSATLTPPPVSGPVISARDRDLLELAHISADAETLAESTQLEMVAERARTIAAQYPTDTEVLTVVYGLTQQVEERLVELQTAITPEQATGAGSPTVEEEAEAAGTATVAPAEEAAGVVEEPAVEQQSAVPEPETVEPSLAPTEPPQAEQPEASTAAAPTEPEPSVAPPAAKGEPAPAPEEVASVMAQIEAASVAEVEEEAEPRFEVVESSSPAIEEPVPAVEPEPAAAQPDVAPAEAEPLPEAVSQPAAVEQPPQPPIFVPEPPPAQPVSPAETQEPAVFASAAAGAPAAAEEVAPAITEQAAPAVLEPEAPAQPREATEVVAPPAPEIAPPQPQPTAPERRVTSGVVTPPARITPPPGPVAPPQPRVPDKVTPPPTAEPARKLPGPPLVRYIGIGAAVLVVLVAVGLILRSLLSKPSAPAAGIPLSVNTTPEGATVRINSQECVTPNCRLNVPAGKFGLEARLDGYEPLRESVDVAAGKPGMLTFTLRPLKSALEINTNFAGGSVYLDRRPAGALQDGQFLAAEVAPGKHTLKISSRDGEAELAFEVAPGRAPSLSSTVQAKNAQAVAVSNIGGRTMLYCDCAGQPVALDGRGLGAMPAGALDLGSLAAGSHELKVGEGASQHTVTVATSPAPTLNVFLNADRNVGTLVVETGEDNVSVFLNNRKYDRTTRGGLLRIPLDVRDYTVRVQKPGFQPVDPQKIELRKNEEARLSFRMQPVAQKAFLAIRGALPDMQVLVDGQPAGAVSADGTLRAEISPGDHAIELSKEGYKPARFQKRVAVGDTLTLARNEVELAKLPSPAPIPVPQPSAAPSSPPVDAAAQEWQRLSNSNDRARLDDFLRKYHGTHQAEQAAKRIEQLDWESAHAANTEPALQAFLHDYGNSPYAQPAREQLERVREAGDRKAIDAILQRYKAAYDGRDKEALQGLWPTMPKDKIKRIEEFFKLAKDVRLNMGDVQTTLSGEKATVSLRQSLQYSAAGKTQTTNEERVTISLHKQRNGVWALESIQ